MRFDDHPTVLAIRSQGGERAAVTTWDDGPVVLDSAWLRSLCLEAGADDVGFVSIDHPDLEQDRQYIDQVLPGIKTLIGFVCRSNVDNLRSPARATANLEFHSSYDEVDTVGRRIARLLNDEGVRAVNPAAGFPQEMERFPDHAWSIPHKRVAVAAGLGRMGIHRLVIHPKFGNFIVLGTVAKQATVSKLSTEIEFNPCLECKLCVSVCPVGAIGNDGSFNFESCYTHNYREFMTGFTDWAQTIADSSDAADYRDRVTDAESSSMWQSLSFKANYKAAYCMAVCPAGEDVIGNWLDDRRKFTQEVVRPLQHKEEILYVSEDSPAIAHATKRFPHKSVKVIDNGFRRPAPRRSVGTAGSDNGAPAVEPSDP